MSHKTYTAIIILLILLILGIGAWMGYRYFYGEQKEPSITQNDPAYAGWHTFTSTIHGYTVSYPPNYVFDNPIPGEEPSGMVQFKKPEGDTNFTIIHTDGMQYRPFDNLSNFYETLPSYLQDGDTIAGELTIGGERAFKVERRGFLPAPYDYYYFEHEGQVYRIEIINPQLAKDTDLFLKSFAFYKNADTPLQRRDRVKQWWNGLINHLMIPGP